MAPVSLHPFLVAGHDQVEENLPIGRVSQGVEEAPGLRVIRGRRPSGGLEHPQQFRFRHGLAGEGAGRATLDEERIDLMVGLTRRQGYLRT